MSTCNCNMPEAVVTTPIVPSMVDAINASMPEDVYGLLVSNNCLLVGGALRAIITSEVPNDWDIASWPRHLLGSLVRLGFECTCAPPSTQGLKMCRHADNTTLDLTTYDDTPSNVISQFCLHHQQLAWVFGSPTLYTNPRALDCIADKRIEIHIGHTSSINQEHSCVQKWRDRGWAG